MRPPSVRRTSEPSWLRPITERLSLVIKAFVIANSLLFAFYVMVREARPFFEEHLALGFGALQGELWQPFTALFVHLDFISFFFSMLGLWFVGATVERSIGTRRFLLLFFITGIIGNVITIALAALWATPFPNAGAGTPVLALFVAFGVIFDRMPARVFGALVMQARVLTAILVGFAILASVTRGSWAGLVADLFAIAVAFAMAGGNIAGIRRNLTAWRARRQRRRYQVIEGGRRGGGGKPTYLN